MHKPSVPQPATPETTDAEPTLRVLIVSSRRVVRERIAARLSSRRVDTVLTRSAGEVRSLDRARFDLVMIDVELPDADAFELCAELSAEGMLPVMLSDTPNMDEAMQALRSGAVDLLTPRSAPEELLSRVRSSAERAKRVQDREDRIRRLKSLCQQLNLAREQVGKHVGELCSDLVGAYQELTERVQQISVASEFAGVLRQELDLENLLRTVLEYVLAKVGPVNAAVFLPGSGGEYALGAYVNYDRGKDSAELLFETLADTVGPRFETAEGAAVFTEPDHLAEALGPSAGLMEGCAFLATPCTHRGESLAVLTLFRSRRAGFTDEQVIDVGVIASLFAAQLSRVISVHHRHLPKDDWSDNA